jgi:hypothetical protein
MAQIINFHLHNFTDKNSDFQVVYWKRSDLTTNGYISLYDQAKRKHSMFTISANLLFVKDVPFYPRTKKASLFLEIEKMIEDGFDFEKVNADLKKGFVQNPSETMLKFAKDIDSLIRANFAFLLDYEELLSFKGQGNQKVTNCKEDIAFVLSELKKCTKPSTHDFLYAYVNFSPFELFLMEILGEFYLPCFFFASSEFNSEMSKTHNTTITIDLHYLNQKPFQLQTGQFGDDVLFLPFTRFQFQSFDKPSCFLNLKAKNPHSFKIEVIDSEESDISKKISGNDLNMIPSDSFAKLNNMERNVELLNTIEKNLKKDLGV